MSESEFDAVVVGAGPAGAAAAFHLARRGRRVALLERSAFPRDKSCGDAVNRAGVELLREMDVLGDLTGAFGIGGLEVSMGPAGQRSTRAFRYGREDPAGGRYGIVVPRALLDHVLVRRAVAEGAVFRQRVQVRGLVREDGVVRGVEAVTPDGREIVRARVVVAADGSTSKLARQSGLVETTRGRLGYAMRTYFSGVPALEDTLSFHMPLDNPATHSRLPAYGWVIPLGPDRANVGAGVAEKHPGVRLDDLFERFVAELRATVPWFAAARQEGPPKGAPLFFGFTPDRSWSPGLVLVGDAAGMINPGTGEGISFALESGKIAAEVIAARPAGPVDDLSEYAATLTRRFSGHLETGRHAVNRHRLAWRVLEDTFDSDRPVFALTRRAMLAPDHTAGFETTAPGALDDIRHCLDPRLRLAAPLVEVGEILADTVRKDWPFLDRLPALLSEEYLMAPRPALLVLLAAAAYQPVRGLTALAAATDLAALAALAQASVDAAPAGGTRRARQNWGTMFAVLTTDLFLARALELCATQDVRITAQLARAIEEASNGRMAELTAARAAEPATSRAWLELSSRSGTAALCAAACEVGATAAGAPGPAATALGEYGRVMGAAAQLADDLRRLSGGLDRLGRDALADLEELDAGLPSLPFRLALSELGGAAGGLGGAAGGLRLEGSSRPERAAEVTVLVGRTTALKQTAAWIQELCRDAQQALSGVAEGPARTSLHAIADHLLRTARPDLGARS
ncbi:geranylgeranyl reductase family protein [Nonomuraea zeae]|uniref:Geranylgeranyl reductase family protein n=1 Tax=Nonomuraea zeae TaxID=1642303 RepID=A0A5S4FM18_9ACTN|nr:geranylgeranyl reductase family protein [Nonomuraea zeae]TMR21241.1 geranylgeranyl reductase family protein [Nonomuraea zeae]